jgi:predicted NUDIX family NTP pyrophosphohydrolase
MKKCSCGFIISTVKNGKVSWLLCHPTNGGNRWDIPKGVAESGEEHLIAARRELYEETGTFLMSPVIIDLGQHSYDNKKDLHLYYVNIQDLDTKHMECISMVENKKGPNFPEMDAFAIFEIEKVASKVGRGLNAWIQAHVPSEFLVGYTMGAT